MNWVLAVITLLSALLPLADKSMQTMQNIKAVRQQTAAYKPVEQVPVPPEAGQANVVFHNGAWWKWDGRQWLVWTNQPQQVAHGGYPHVVR